MNIKDSMYDLSDIFTIKNLKHKDIENINVTENRSRILTKKWGIYNFSLYCCSFILLIAMFPVISSYIFTALFIVCILYCFYCMIF